MDDIRFPTLKEPFQPGSKQRPNNETKHSDLTLIQIKHSTNFIKKPFFFFFFMRNREEKRNSTKQLSRLEEVISGKQMRIFLFFLLIILFLHGFFPSYFFVYFLFNSGSYWLRPTPDDYMEVYIYTPFLLCVCAFYFQCVFSNFATPVYAKLT